MKNNKGFTLVELIAVIALIGVLIIVFVPLMTNAYRRAKNSINDMDKQSLFDGLDTYLTNLKENGYELETHYVYDSQCKIQDSISNYNKVTYKTNNDEELSGYDFVKYAAENDLYITVEYLVNHEYLNKGCLYNPDQEPCKNSSECKLNKECTLVVHYESTKTKANPNCTGDNCTFYYELGNHTTSFLDESKCIIK